MARTLEQRITDLEKIVMDFLNFGAKKRPRRKATLPFRTYTPNGVAEVAY